MGTHDLRQFHSDYFLTRDEVDKFKDEVHRTVHNAPDDADAPWLSDSRDSGDPADGSQGRMPCTDRWKSSAAEHEKRALDIYDATGLFASACRHSFILKACEMVQSGEL